MAEISEQDLFVRVQDKVNLKPLKTFLAEFQGIYPGRIVTTGNQPELIEHLRDVVAQKLIPIERVFNLLRECEENGNQTILYYSPKTAAVRELCRDPEAVAARLFGADWERTQDFPKLVSLANGYEVVDFRVGLPDKPSDWLLKIMTFQESRGEVRQLDRGELVGERFRDNEYAVLYERKVIDAVCLARWNDHPRNGLLEVRVELRGRRDRFKMDVAAVWDRLQRAFEWENDFDPWELGSAQEQMLRECEQHQDTYHLGLTDLLDSDDVGVKYTTSTEHVRVDTKPVRLSTIHRILDDGGRCSKLVVTWLPKGSDGNLEDKLRTYGGSRQTNELVISAQTTARAVDYVTNRLRYFAG